MSTWLYEKHLQELREELAAVNEKVLQWGLLTTYRRMPIISATHAMCVAKRDAYRVLQTVIEKQIAMAEEHRAQWEKSHVDPSKQS